MKSGRGTIFFRNIPYIFFLNCMPCANEMKQDLTCLHHDRFLFNVDLKRSNPNRLCSSLHVCNSIFFAENSKNEYFQLSLDLRMER